MKINYWLLVILSCILTLITQIIYHYVPGSDAIRFIQLAQNYSQLNFFDATLNCYGHQFYAFFLYLLGGWVNYNHFFIGFIQTLVFCLASIFLIRELEIYYQRNLLGLAILLFLIPEIHFFNGYLLTESIAYSFLIYGIGLAVRIINERSSPTTLFNISFVIGCLILHRMECTVILITIFYLIYPKIKANLVLNSLILSVFPIMFLLVSVTINYKTYDRLKFTSFNGGEVIYGGNNPNLDGSHHCFDQQIELFIPEKFRNEFMTIQSLPAQQLFPKRDSLYIKMATDTWRTDPILQLGVIPDKIAKNWLLPGFFDIYTGDFSKLRGLQIKKLMSPVYFNNTWYAPYKHSFYMIIHWLLLGLILWGVFTFHNYNRFKMAVAITLIIFVLFAIPFCGLPRWHVPVFPLLIITFMPHRVIEWVNNRLVKLKIT